ncbi:MAG: hypothetical protein KC422_03140 [Trueperaceae bacterium]|nr:hypothetical protein [Trueperaceae bacterium]
MKLIFSLFICLPGLAFAQVALVPYEVAGLTFKLPANWQVQSDDYSVIAYENPNDEDAALLGLFAFVSQGGTNTSAEQVADSMLESFDLTSQGFYSQLMDENTQQGALYRLYQLYDAENVGYLSTYTYVDAQSGAIYYLFYSALQDNFVAYGGPALPLVAFVGMDESLLEYTGATSPQPLTDPYAGSESCEDQAANASNQQEANLVYKQCVQDRQAAYEVMSQISAMSHETMMKTIYNLDTGWCYSGEAGCY